MLEADLPARAPSERLRVVEYTDPYSIWCWGCEPTIRRLQYRYRDSVSVEVRMGGLFEDFTPMRDYWIRLSGGRWKESVRAFMVGVASQHRMPMDPDRMLTSVDDFTSTWPACVATKAAEFQGLENGHRYLRRLREAALVEGRPIHQRRVQLEVASEIGLGVKDFGTTLDDGSAERAFRRDLDECRSLKITGFPTFECASGFVSLRVEGWQPWEVFEDVLRKLNPGVRPRDVERTGAAALEVLGIYPRCATVELAAVLGVTDDEAEILLEDLEVRGQVRRRVAGSGVLWELPPGDSEQAASELGA